MVYVPQIKLVPQPITYCATLERCSTVECSLIILTAKIKY